MPRALCVTAVAASVLTLVGCSTVGSADDLVDAIAAQDGSAVSLDSAFDGEWDEYLVVCPYSSGDGIEERLGFEWSDAPEITLGETSQTLLLVRDEKVVADVEVSRLRVDLCADPGGGLQAGSTQIDFRQNGRGVWVAE